MFTFNIPDLWEDDKPEYREIRRAQEAAMKPNVLALVRKRREDDLTKHFCQILRYYLVPLGIDALVKPEVGEEKGLHHHTYLSEIPPPEVLLKIRNALLKMFGLPFPEANKAKKNKPPKRDNSRKHFHYRPPDPAKGDSPEDLQSYASKVEKNGKSVIHLREWENEFRGPVARLILGSKCGGAIKAGRIGGTSESREGETSGSPVEETSEENLPYLTSPPDERLEGGGTLESQNPAIHCETKVPKESTVDKTQRSDGFSLGRSDSKTQRNDFENPTLRPIPAKENPTERPHYARENPTERTDFEEAPAPSSKEKADWRTDKKDQGSYARPPGGGPKEILPLLGGSGTAPLPELVKEPPEGFCRTCFYRGRDLVDCTLDHRCPRCGNQPNTCCPF